MAFMTKKRSAVAAVRAGIAGRVARRDGRPITDCPFSPSSADPVERFLARYWVMGWNRSERPITS